LYILALRDAFIQKRKLSFNTKYVNLKSGDIKLIRIMCIEFGRMSGVTDLLKFEVLS